MTVRLLLQDVADGIRVLPTRDGVDLTDEQIIERARNIVTGLLGNYRIRCTRSAPGTARRARPPDGPPRPDRGPRPARNNGRPGRA